jgi:transcriptional regulator of arginine metabolism
MKLPKQTRKNIDFALRQLLLEGSASTHEDICNSLEKQGFSVNQPKISRLLHKIGAIKVTDPDGQNIYRLPHAHGLMHELNTPAAKFPLKQSIINIDHNTALIVIHTLPGAAALVAREIDLHHSNLGILGSIAGDDTIFIAPKEAKNIKQIIEKIRSILQL